jgi:polysaccharide biosynthesis transport protein
MATSTGELANQAWAVCRRRRWLGISVCLFGVCAVATCVVSVPIFYRATVVIELSQVAESSGQSTVTSEVDARLSVIRQEILSPAALERLIARFELYPELRGKVPSGALVDTMRREIHLELEAQENRWRGPGGPIAFALSYQGRDPGIVAAVANALAASYVEEHRQEGERREDGSAKVVRAQVEEAQRRLAEHEQRVSEFGTRYLGGPPHDKDSILRALDRLNSQLQVNRETQVRLLGRRQRLLQELASPAELGGEREMGADGSLAELSRLKRQLRELQRSYSDKYPDVIRLKEDIASLERDLAGKDLSKPTDPKAGISALTTEGSRLDTELKGLRDQEITLRGAIQEQQRRLEDAPQHEQQLQKVSRDYEAAKELYMTLLKRYQHAELAGAVEAGQRGERVRILGSALVYKTPSESTRRLALIIGIVLSVGLGIGAMWIAERLDQSLHRVEDLGRLTTLPIFSIPRIVGESERRTRRHRMLLGIGGVSAGISLLIFVCHTLASGNARVAWLLLQGNR